ncbi:phospholipase A2 inhibitor LNF1-like [Pantherophis guttatus]|uniref:Phospholipase A2 inhibitor LNF1-like n=1 Tax=Pantherophis guttatus TaxID=94885 RepID=A0A6P9DBK2_PANGU|nr:phospholipase A2 inhibitor LNF1-like [Pantherophis guttatus]
MQLLLGLFFFSVLLTTGNSLSCEICNAQSSDCSGSKQECGFDNAVCMKMTTELNVGSQKVQNTMKSCSPKDGCKLFEEQKGKASSSQVPGIPVGAVIKEVICSKAPPSFASFFPAFLGLLLMKLLF